MALESFDSEKQMSASWNAVYVALGLFIISFGIRLVDIFVLRLDETPFNIITSKSIPIILILLYLWHNNKTVSEIGVHSNKLGFSFLFGVIIFLVFDGTQIVVDLVMMVVVGSDPVVGLAQIPPEWGLYLFGFYIVNSFMEEGLFRGLMMRQFMTKMPAGKANILQSLLFGIWHIVWPIKAYISGEMDLTGFIGYGFQYVLVTFVAGLVFGYMFQKSNSLIGPMVLHTIHNMYASFIVIELLAEEAYYTSITFIVTMGMMPLAVILTIYSIRWFTQWAKQQDIIPWGQTATLEEPGDIA
ncbi:MAG: lysostaphin resistance A-like protein [Candidatus Thorarchaeota archaeon]